MTDPLYAPVPGFRFAGIHAGIKKSGLDLAAIEAIGDANSAGVFTKNLVCAAPVHLARRAVEPGTLRAILVNSGNANAATGPRGMKDAEHLLGRFAQELDTTAGRIAPCSTGVIGVPLPVDLMAGALPALAADLHEDGAARFSDAILTTDRGRKAARRTFTHEGTERSVLAIAKGAGMIHPNMATTLAFVVTDAPCTNLRSALQSATDATFNRITVDGDTSTNDTILAMSSGGAFPGSAVPCAAFASALRQVLGDVAEMIVADGEGAQHVAEIHVSGATDNESAVRIARTIATSSLVKTAMHGCDPNWGRIAAAAGRAGVAFDPNALRVGIEDVVLFEDGAAQMTPEREELASSIMKRPRYRIVVQVGTGPGHADYLTCDLGHDYVSVNADYRS